jgi:hypothetical protein
VLLECGISSVVTVIAQIPATEVRWFRQVAQFDDIEGGGPWVRASLMTTREIKASFAGAGVPLSEHWGRHGS